MDSNSSQQKTDPLSSNPLLSRVFTVSGVLLAVFVCAHLWIMAGALSGRRVLSMRLTALHALSGWVGLVTVLVLIPLVVHVLLAGWSVAVRKPWRYLERGTKLSLSAAHRAAGFVLIGFLVVHGATIAWPVLSGAVAPEMAYDLLVASLSQSQAAVPWRGLLQLIGVAAVSFHLVWGVGRVVVRIWRTDGGMSRLLRWLVVVVGIVLLAVGTDITIYLATSTKLFSMSVADTGLPEGAIRCPDSELVLVPFRSNVGSSSKSLKPATLGSSSP